MAHLAPITPLTLAAIKANEWCGNAWSDGPAFESVEKFARSDAPIAERAEALRIMGRDGMGLSDEEMGIVGLDDAAQVADYLASIDEYDTDISVFGGQ